MFEKSEKSDDMQRMTKFAWLYSFLSKHYPCR